MRKLATIRTISEIKQIEGADKIEMARVDGWECVIAKKDNFKQGDLVIYIEIDSIVPERPEFEFLRDRKFRVRTIKLRGQISQGLIIPISFLPKGIKIEEGNDVTDTLGIKKYDVQAEQETKQTTVTRKFKNPIMKYFMRFKLIRKLFTKPDKSRCKMPSWIPITDEERIQNLSKLFYEERDKGTRFVETEKIDGQSLTVFMEKIKRKYWFGYSYNFGVCSRNWQLLKEDNSSWWTVAKQIKAKEVLRDLLDKNNLLKRIYIQGEIIGTGIQGNKYKINGYDFYAFNLNAGGGTHKVHQDTMKDVLSKYNIKTVKVVNDNYQLPEKISDVVEHVKGKSLLYDVNREGSVFRNYSVGISFKCINPEFLLKNEE